MWEPVGRFEAGLEIGDEVRVVGGVFDTLRNGPRPVHRASGLDPGKPAEPSQLDVAVLEHLDRRRVVGGRDVPDRYAQALLEVLRHRIELEPKHRGVVVRDRAEPEGALEAQVNTIRDLVWKSFQVWEGGDGGSGQGGSSRRFGGEE